MQAREALRIYIARVDPAEDRMRAWLGCAAKRLREREGRKMSHVAAEADTDQSTIYRFETPKYFDAWPRNADHIVAAYARDLGLDPVQVWAHAIRLWRDSQGEATGGDGGPDPLDLTPPGGFLGPSDASGPRRSANRQRKDSGG